VELRTRVQNITRLNRYRRLMVERVKFDWVLDQANEGYLMLDEDERIIYANPQARLYLDLPQEELEQITQPFREVAGKQYHFEPKQAWDQWPDDPAAHVPRYLVRPESANSKPFWLRIDSLNLPAGVEAQQVISLRDVTAEMELQRDVWRFHSMVFHKLRTPLAVMMNSLELLARHASKLGAEKNAEVAQRALQGGRRLQRTILWEVIENAKKFHPENDPSVQVFAFRMTKANEIGIWVGDDGLTLSPEQLAQVWMPYYQGEKAFTGEVSGMGLGLPMVAALLWGVGGRCRMYNRPDEPGVIVELIIPVEDEEAETAEVTTSNNRQPTAA
jgi:signal transduction histidine kinase